MAILFVPILMAGIAAGGWPYSVGVAVVLAMGAHEFGSLFRSAGRRPAMPVMVLGTAAIALAFHMGGWQMAGVALAVTALVSMAWHAVDYERGGTNPGSDFVISLAGISYVGWLGAYLIALRNLPDGKWWVLLALPTVWLADGGAYAFGSWLGRRPLVPRLSPKKTWEGYLGGILTAALGGMGFAALWRIGAGSMSLITPAVGLVNGLLLAALTPLGDLGISMLKREHARKDTGTILPGHGGFLDRMDTWLWAAFITTILVKLIS